MRVDVSALMAAPARMAGPAAALGLLAVALVGPRDLSAQPAEELDAGQLEIRVDGRRVGSERFAIRREGRQIRAVGRIEADTSSTAVRALQSGVRVGPDFTPELFRLQLSRGEVQRVVAVREEGRLRVQLTSSEGDRWKEFLAPEDLTVIEPRVAHQWYLVLRQHRDALGEAGSVRVPAVLPMERRRADLELRRHGPEDVDLPGARRSAVRYTATLDGAEEIRIWTDEEGRVLRLTIPGRAMTSVRLPEATG